ncbi:hypothetical protein B0T16DRAFT_383826 [Cercophora newfieldiana]|uniref:Uncharacterized protein n=1 Tax=Cercophora newfieldiana TaxID=92897 RepID=A0AA39YLJ5_9PEZI|nr:hypothetical protein B0T16DRAFT_383826 [Cercophora newfieldiana]
MEASSDISDHTEITVAQSLEPLQRIGYGSCGSVWADASRFPDIDRCTSACALKRADGLPDRSLENEANMHRHILSRITTFATNGFRVNLPRHIAFLQQKRPNGKIFSLGYPLTPAHAKL